MSSEIKPVSIYLDGEALVFESQDDEIPGLLYPSDIDRGGSRIGTVVIHPSQMVSVTPEALPRLRHLFTEGSWENNDCIGDIDMIDDPA